MMAIGTRYWPPLGSGVLNGGSFFFWENSHHIGIRYGNKFVVRFKAPPSYRLSNFGPLRGSWGRNVRLGFFLFLFFFFFFLSSSKGGLGMREAAFFSLAIYEKRN